MSAPVSISRAGGSVWTASGRAIASLAIFVVVFIAFLLAPLLALAVAALAYLVFRPRSRRSSVEAPVGPAGFGAGAALPSGEFGSEAGEEAA